MQHVDDTLAAASVAICQRLLPKACVSLRHGVPDTLESATRFFNDNSTIAVSSYMSPRRFMGTAECAQAFDAWHDFCHVTLQASFDIPGEERVNALQQAHLRTWATAWSGRRVTEAELKRASAMLDMNNLGRLHHWHQWQAAPTDVRSFAGGWLAALGMADKPARAPVDIRNEWTTYEES